MRCGWWHVEEEGDKEIWKILHTYTHTYLSPSDISSVSFLRHFRNIFQMLGVGAQRRPKLPSKITRARADHFRVPPGKFFVPAITGTREIAAAFSAARPFPVIARVGASPPHGRAR